MSSGTKRPRPSTGKSRKSNKQTNVAKDDSDAPLSTEDHRNLVEALYETGLKHASPSVILEQIKEDSSRVLTSEQVKSHLQKYRKNRDKAKVEFMSDYDHWLDRVQTVGLDAPPHMLAAMLGSDKPRGGETAACVTYSVMQEDASNTRQKKANNISKSSNSDYVTLEDFRKRSLDLVGRFAGARVAFPVLTAEERASPLGKTMSRVISLFYPMTQHLMGERLRNDDDTVKSSDNNETLGGLQHVDYRQENPSQQEMDGNESNPSIALSTATLAAAGMLPQQCWPVQSGEYCLPYQLPEDYAQQSTGEEEEWIEYPQPSYGAAWVYTYEEDAQQSPQQQQQNQRQEQQQQNQRQLHRQPSEDNHDQEWIPPGYRMNHPNSR